MASALDTKSVVVTLFMFLWTCTSRATSIAALHGRVYANSAEKDRRQQIFKDNLGLHTQTQQPRKKELHFKPKPFC